MSGSLVAFVVRRLVWTLPVVLLVIFLTFVLMRQIEGNPFRTSERNVPESIQRNLERKFNLDEPWYVQYALYTKNVFTFDLGPSLVLRNRSVNDIVRQHFPVSIELGGLAFLIAPGSQVSNAAHLGGLLFGYVYLKSRTGGGGGSISAEIKYRYLNWKMNQLRKKVDVHQGGKGKPTVH